jgi:hypothetical protein
MRINEILTEEQLDEIDRRGFLRGIGAAALGAAALGSMGNASARVMPGDDPSVNRLTGKPNTELSVQSDRPSQPSAEMPNQNLQAVDKVDRTTDSITITQDGKSYEVKVMSKGSPTPRGGKIMKVQQAQVGERGIGNYIVYLMPNGTAYLYK